MNIYNIRIDRKLIPIANESMGIYNIVNPLVLLVPNHIPLVTNGDDISLKCVGDLNIALSKQYIDKKPTDILREDVLTNELD